MPIKCSKSIHGRDAFIEWEESEYALTFCEKMCNNMLNELVEL